MFQYTSNGVGKKGSKGIKMAEVECGEDKSVSDEKFYEEDEGEEEEELSEDEYEEEQELQRQIAEAKQKRKRKNVMVKWVLRLVRSQ